MSLKDSVEDLDDYLEQILEEKPKTPTKTVAPKSVSIGPTTQKRTPGKFSDEEDSFSFGLDDKTAATKFAAGDAKLSQSAPLSSKRRSSFDSTDDDKTPNTIKLGAVTNFEDNSEIEASVTRPATSSNETRTKSGGASWLDVASGDASWLDVASGDAPAIGVSVLDERPKTVPGFGESDIALNKPTQSKAAKTLSEQLLADDGEDLDIDAIIARKTKKKARPPTSAGVDQALIESSVSAEKPLSAPGGKSAPLGVDLIDDDNLAKTADMGAITHGQAPRRQQTAPSRHSTPFKKDSNDDDFGDMFAAKSMHEPTTPAPTATKIDTRTITLPSSPPERPIITQQHAEMSLDVEKLRHEMMTTMKQMLEEYHRQAESLRKPDDKPGFLRETANQSRVSADFLKEMKDKRDSLMQEEQQMLKEHCEEQIASLTRSFELREARLRKDIDRLQRELDEVNEDRDQDKNRLQYQQKQRMQTIEERHHEELNTINDRHRQEIAALRSEHSEVVRQLKQAKVDEVEALSSLPSNSAALKRLVDQIDDLHRRLSDRLRSETTQLTEGDRVRQQQLTSVVDQLTHHLRTSQTESVRMQELITRLDNELVEANKRVERERRELDNERMKLAVLKQTTEQTRDQLRDQMEKERVAVSEMRAEALADQQRALNKIIEERDQLRQEREQFERRKAEHDAHYADMAAKVGSVDRERRDLDAEKSRVTQQLEQLAGDKVQAASLRQEVESERRALHAAETELQKRADSVDQKFEAALHLESEAKEMKRKAESIQRTCEEQQLQQQAKLKEIDERRSELLAERMKQAEDKARISAMMAQFTCNVCHTPVKEREVRQIIARTDPALNRLQADIKGFATELVKQQNLSVWKQRLNNDRAYLENEEKFLKSLHEMTEK